MFSRHVAIEKCLLWNFSAVDGETFFDVRMKMSLIFVMSSGWYRRMTSSSLAALNCYGELFSKASFATLSIAINPICCSLTFTSIALRRYWTFFNTTVADSLSDESFRFNSSENHTISCLFEDVIFVKIYLIAVNAIVALNLPILLLMIYNSAQGSIADTKARHYISPLLYLK